MSIKIQCPQCGSPMKVYEEHLGLRVRCPRPECGHRFVAEQSAPAEIDPPAVDPLAESGPAPEQPLEDPLFPVGAGPDDSAPADVNEGGNSALNMLMQASDDAPPPQREVRPKPSIRGESAPPEPSPEGPRPARPVRPRVSLSSGGPAPAGEPTADDAPPAPAPRPAAKAPAKPAAAPSPFPESPEDTEPMNRPENSGLAGLAAALGGGGEQEPPPQRPASVQRGGSSKRVSQPAPAPAASPFPETAEETESMDRPENSGLAGLAAALGGGRDDPPPAPRGRAADRPTKVIPAPAKGKSSPSMQPSDSLLGALAAAADGGEDAGGSGAPLTAPPPSRQREPARQDTGPSAASQSLMFPAPVPVGPVPTSPQGATTPLGPVGLHLSSPVPMPNRINGSGVYLRPLKADDMAAFERTLEDADLARTSAAVRNLAATRDSGMLDRIGRDDSTMVMAVCLRDSDKLIGAIGLYDIDWRNRSARFEVLFVASEQGVSGKGLRTNGARALAEHAFRELNIHRLWTLIYESNPRNRRLYGLLGFLEEGRLRQSYYCDGKYWDLVVWGLLAPEYFEKKRLEQQLGQAGPVAAPNAPTQMIPNPAAAEAQPAGAAEE